MSAFGRAQQLNISMTPAIVGLALAIVGCLLAFVLRGHIFSGFAGVWRGVWVVAALPVLGLLGYDILRALFAAETGAMPSPAKDGLGDISRFPPIFDLCLFLILAGLPMLVMHSALIGDDLNRFASTYWSLIWMTTRYIVTALILLSIAALIDRSTIRPGLFAALWIIVVTILTYDWIMTAEAGWVSSGLAILVAGFALLAGAALTILHTLNDGDDRQPANRLIVMIMIAVFLALAHQLVVWSGDRPASTIWYVTRLSDGWFWFQLAGFLLLGLALVLMIGEAFGDSFDTFRGKKIPTIQTAAYLILSSVAIQSAWWVLPGNVNLLISCVLIVVLLAAGYWASRPFRAGAADDGGTHHG